MAILALLLQTGQPNPQMVLYGQLAVIGMLVVVIAMLFSFTERRVTRIVDARLNEPDSALSTHSKDPDAHEKMRTAMTSRFEERLQSIERQIATQRDSAHEDFQGLLKQHQRTLDMLDRALDRQGRRRRGEDAEETS